MAQSRSQLHPVNDVLRELAIDLDPGQKGFIADKIFSDAGAVIDMTPYGRNATVLIDGVAPYLGNADLDLRRAADAPRKAQRGGETTSLAIAIEEYAIEESIDRLTEIDAQLPGDEERRAMRRVLNTLMIAREKRCADLFFGAGNWTNQAVAAFGPAAWNAAAGTPLSDLSLLQETIHDASGGHMPDTLIMDFAVLRAVSKNPEVRSVINGGGGQSVSGSLPLPDQAVVDLLESFLGLRVCVARKMRNTANVGQAATPARIWTDSVWMGCMGGSDAIRTGAGPKLNAIAAADFSHTALRPGVYDRANQTGRVVYAEEIGDMLKVEGSLGYLLTDAIA